jgi:hypothetical protein
MATTPRARQGEVLRYLTEEQGLQPGHYARFFVTGEGRYLAGAPDIEKSSGCVLYDQGRVFAFLLGWDERRAGPALTEWEEEEPESFWTDVSEYRRAREQLGLISA